MFDLIPKGELRWWNEGRLIDPTRPTACSIQLARSASWTDPTRRTGELVDVSGPTRPFGVLDDGCFAVRDPLSEALSNLSRRLIMWIIFGIVTKLDLGVPASLFFLKFISLFQRGHFRRNFRCWFRWTDFDPNNIIAQKKENYLRNHNLNNIVDWY